MHTSPETVGVVSGLGWNGQFGSPRGLVREEHWKTPRKGGRNICNVQNSNNLTFQKLSKNASQM